MAIHDQIDELIREIAVKHNIAVHRDDPIMILHTINDILMQKNQSAQAEMLKAFQSEMEMATARWIDESKRKSERILSVSLNAASTKMTELMQEGAETAAKQVRVEISKEMETINTKIREIQRVSFQNLVTSCITLLAALVAMWVALK